MGALPVAEIIAYQAFGYIVNPHPVTVHRGEKLMGDTRDDNDSWPPDDDADVDWATLYALRPNLWNDYLEELEAALDEGRASPGTLADFMERCLRTVKCLSDFHARLPGLRLSLAAFVDLREKALAAEAAALRHENDRSLRADRPARAHKDGPLSPTLAAAIVNLHLRGLDEDRIICALGIHTAWPQAVLRRTHLHAGAHDVVREHLAGASLAQIEQRTGVPVSSALRVIRQIDEKPNGVGKRVDARARARDIVKLRRRGLAYKEIAERLDCSLDTVRNALRRDAKRRYRGLGDRD